MPYLTITPMTPRIAELIFQKMVPLRAELKKVVAQVWRTIPSHVEVHLVQSPIDADEDGPDILIEARMLPDKQREQEAQMLSDEIEKVVRNYLPDVVLDVWPWWSPATWTRYKPE